MSKRIQRLICLASLVSIAFCAVYITVVFAQETVPISKQMPIRHSKGMKLDEQQQRGAGLFFQRCALCHLSKSFGSAGSKYCCVSSLGPSLSGVFKDIDTEQEQSMRQIILNGGPTYMPAWKYGLTSKDIDDIVAYLKTLG